MQARLALCCAALLVGCATRRAPAPAHPPIARTTDSSRTAEEPPLFEIPEPEPGSSPRHAQRPSVLRVGVTVPLAPIRDAANAMTPLLLAEEHRAPRWNPFHFSPGYSYRATRGPIELTGAGAAIEWSVPVYIHGSAPVVGACNARLVARASTRLSVSPQWDFASTSTRGPIEWQEHCRIVLGLIDVTSTIEPHVRGAQDAMAREIDARVSAQSLHSALSALWATLQQRVALPRELGLWLRPSALGVSAITARADAIEATVEITVQPIAALEPPLDLEAMPLPSNSPVGSGDPEVRVHVDVEVPLTLLAAELQSALPALLGGLEVRAVRGIGGRDAVWLGFVLDRPARMTAWFGAELGVDATGRAITVTHLRATPETRAALASVGFDVGVIERLLPPSAAIPIDDRLDDLQRQYEALASSTTQIDGAELHVVPGRIELAEVFHTPTTAGITLAISGSANVVLTGQAALTRLAP